MFFGGFTILGAVYSVVDVMHFANYPAISGRAGTLVMSLRLIFYCAGFSCTFFFLGCGTFGAKHYAGPVALLLGAISAIGAYLSAASLDSVAFRYGLDAPLLVAILVGVALISAGIVARRSRTK